MAMIIGMFSVTQLGDVGGQGVSRFAVQNSAGTIFSNTELNAVAAALLAFYTSIKSSLPTVMSYTVQPSANMITMETGALVSQEAIPVTGTVAGSTTGSYAAGVGARVYWHTGQVRHRRLMRGATYVAPVVSNGFTTNGVLLSTTTSGMTTAATALINAILGMGGSLNVYGRPTAPNATDGIVGVVSSATISSKAASLRSRRS